MSTQLPTPNPPTQSSSRSAATLIRELEEHLQRYRQSHGVPIPAFHFLNRLQREISHDTRSRFLKALLPETELQIEHTLLNPTSALDEMGVTFPDFELFMTEESVRRAAASCRRRSRPTWKQFRESSIASMFMQHVDAVTFSIRMRAPSYMYLTAKFDGNGPLIKTEAKGHRIKQAYNRLDCEYIEMEFEKLMIRWTESWKPATLTFEVIETLALELRRMYQNMRW